MRASHGFGALTLRCAFVMGSIVLVSAACTSSDPSTYDGPHSTECSTGPPTMPVGHAEPSKNYRSLPQCVPRCGGEQKFLGAPYGSVYSMDALPSGSCSNSGERCQIAAGTTLTCDGVTVPCNLSGLECVCSDNAWRCYFTSQGAGVCLPCHFDDGGAGRDATTDVSNDGG